MPSFDLEVQTSGGIHDLGRVVGTLARFDLTPTRLGSTKLAGGLRVAMRIEGDPRACELCAKRLGVLPAIEAVVLSPTAAEMEEWPWICATASF